MANASTDGSGRDRLYGEIAEYYRQKITSGELQPGAKLPTIREIQTLWEVSNSTAAAAMAELRREGLTSPRPRHGTVVTTPPLPLQALTSAEALTLPDGHRSVRLPISNPVEAARTLCKVMSLDELLALSRALSEEVTRLAEES